MKIVAVSQRIDNFMNRGEVRDSIDQRLVSFIQTCGFVAVPVPNLFQTTYFDFFMNQIKPDAFVLSGGNNIGEYKARDRTERAMLAFAEKKNLPLLGICRGMQMMAHISGVDCVEVPGHVGTRHSVYGEIIGEVNSYHNFCISKCPKNYSIIAMSGDKAIEAMKHRRLPWEGWMWHPEREDHFETRDVERLQRLFDY